MEKYRIISGLSQGGEKINIPIPWTVDLPQSDIHVFLVTNSGAVIDCDFWNWNSATSSVEIPQQETSYSAYVSRKEDASTLLQLLESKEVDAQNIVEQFRKTNRIIEALQEKEKTTVRAPDYINGVLPNASHRANYFLTFDEDGNPSCDIEATAFSEAKRLTTLAMNASELAQRKAEEAQRKAETAQGKAEDAQRKSESASSQAQQYASNADNNAANALTSATSASNSATNALTSATNASNSASSASMSAGNAKTSETNSKNSETQAKLSETNARQSEEKSALSEKNAHASAVEANTILNTFLLGERVTKSLQLELDDGRQLKLIATVENGIPSLKWDIAETLSDTAFKQIRMSTEDDKIIILKGVIRNGVPMLDYDFE